MPAYLKPQILPPNGVIGIAGLSGCLTDLNTLTQAIHYFTEKGYSVRLAKNLNSQYLYFAGTDSERLNHFMELIEDPEINVILMARGGYGITRLLPHLNFKAIAQSRKIIVGFSDVTALHLALLSQGHYISYAGPMACPDFGKPQPNPVHEEHFFARLAHQTISPFLIPMEPTSKSFPEGLQGYLWGGNLSLVVHLIGTPYMPKIKNGILFLEEVNEEPYHIERMLMQLWHSGLLSQQKAILIGSFQRCIPKEKSAVPYTLASVMEYLQHLVPCPILFNLPFGHIAEKITLPIGGLIELKIHDPHHWFIDFLDY